MGGLHVELYAGMVLVIRGKAYGFWHADGLEADGCGRSRRVYVCADAPGRHRKDNTARSTAPARCCSGGKVRRRNDQKHAARSCLTFPRLIRQTYIYTER
ncbi:unnamed protein product [Ectocarpus fasciculatus]